jgi:prophage DNA circulation protein
MPSNDDLGRTLSACNFEGIAFPVIAAPAEEGWDGAEHTALGRRGADCEPTGYQPIRGTIRAAFLNDLTEYRDLYPRTYRELIQKIRTTPIGRLVHPYLGTFQAWIKAVRHDFDSDVRNGCHVDLTFTEHNGEASLLSDDSGAVPTDSPSATTSRASVADDAMLLTGSTRYTPTSATIATQLAYLESGTRSYAQITTAIRAMLSVVETNMALSDFAGVTGHAAIAALESLRASVLELQSRYLGAFARIATYTVPTAMALWQVAVAVYGDASRGQLIQTVNSIPDPTLIRAGTVLRIVPLAA